MSCMTRVMTTGGGPGASDEDDKEMMPRLTEASSSSEHGSSATDLSETSRGSGSDESISFDISYRMFRPELLTTARRDRDASPPLVVLHGGP